MAAIAAQWLTAAGWAIPPVLIAAVLAGMLVRAYARQGHACARGNAGDSSAKKVGAALTLALVALCALRSPLPSSSEAKQVRDLLDAQGRSAGPIRLVAVVAEPPRYRDGSASLILRAERFGPGASENIGGLFRLRIAHCGGRFAAGERLALRTSLRSFSNFGNPGEFDWAGWNHRRGVFVSAFVWSDRDVVLLGESESAGFVTRLRAAVGRIAGRLDTQGAALVAAVTVGDRGGLTEETVLAIRDAGMAHALAISGLHVGLLAGAALALGRRALLRTDYVRSGFDALLPACAAAGGAALFYAALGGGGVSVFRAVTMGVAALWVLAMAGEARPLQVLGLAAVALSLSSPGVATEPGFQLSFAATLSLVALARRRPHVVTGFLLVPLLAWAVTTPIVAQHFQRISLVAPLVNLVAAPLVSATVLTGLIAAALLPLSAPLATPVFTLAAWFATGLLWLCEQAASLPGAAVDVVSPGVLLAFLLSAFPTLLLLDLPRRRTLFAAAGALVVLLSAHAFYERSHGGRLDIHFVSVGQGDATIIKLPGGAIAVVDGGRPGRGRLAVGPWLGRLRVRRIDFLIATHAQADHWAGLAELADRFEIGEFWHNGGVCDVEAFNGFLARLQADGVTIVDVGSQFQRSGEGPRWSFADAEMVALGPRSADGPCQANDRSLVLSVRYGDQAVLLGGDIEAAGERALLESGAEMRHAVIKAPHHGSGTSSTAGLLDAVEPWLAVASCGQGNRYGFPHEAVVDRYRERGSQFLSTDRHGAVSLRLDASGIGLRTAKKL